MDTVLVEYIRSLYEGWTDEIMTVLDATPPESVEQRDLYDRPPELLRSWADGNVVLIGDAVHAMIERIVYNGWWLILVCISSELSFCCVDFQRPNLGEGGCQALEDAYVKHEIDQSF